MLGALAGLVTGIVLATAWWTFDPAENVPREVQDAINEAKAGNDETARRLLEANGQNLTPPAITILAELYARGKGGPVDDARAMAAIRLLDCSYLPIGETEYSISTLIMKEDANAAARWLMRAGEAGYAAAIDLLSDPVKLSASGYDISAIDVPYWKTRKADKSLGLRGSHCKQRSP